MHSSISAHIADEYLLDEQAGMWGPNLALFQQRLGNPEASARIENLYFTYLFVLRAFMKAGPLLSSAQYTTGCPQQDAETAGVMQQLVSPASVSGTASAAYRCTFKLLSLNEGHCGLVVLSKRHTGLLLRTLSRLRWVVSACQKLLWAFAGCQSSAPGGLPSAL